MTAKSMLDTKVSILAVAYLLLVALLVQLGSALYGPVYSEFANPDCSGTPSDTKQYFTTEALASPYGTCVLRVPGPGYLKAYCGGGQLIEEIWSSSDCTTGTHSRSISSTGVCFSSPNPLNLSYMYRCNETDPFTHAGPDQIGPRVGDLGIFLPDGDPTCPSVDHCTSGTPYTTSFANSSTCDTSPEGQGTSIELIPGGQLGVCYNMNPDSVSYSMYMECEPGIIRAYYYNYGCNSTASSIYEFYFNPGECYADPGGESEQYYCTPNIIPADPVSAPANAAGSLSMVSTKFFLVLLSFLLVLSLF